MELFIFMAVVYLLDKRFREENDREILKLKEILQNGENREIPAAKYLLAKEMKKQNQPFR